MPVAGLWLPGHFLLFTFDFLIFMGSHLSVHLSSPVPRPATIFLPRRWLRI